MDNKNVKPEEIKTTQIRFTLDQHRWLEDEAMKNRRAGIQDKSSMSALVRYAVEEYRQKIMKGE